MLRDVYGALLHWVREREAVRLRKESGAAPPWTEDPVLREWRFCNVDRCDDRVTRWVMANVVAPHEGEPELWFNLAVARLVNWPPTLEALGYVREWDAARFAGTLAGLRGKVFTGAYMVPAGPAGTPKAAYLADATLTPLWSARGSAPRGGTCADWAAFLGGARSLGDFLANQVVTDMKYARGLLLEAPDRSTFALAGPGTRRGLNRLLGRPLEAGWRQPEAGAAILELRARLAADEPALAPKLEDPNNVANCLCEFDKYARVLLGEGKPRARYAPRPPGDAW